MGFFDKFFNKDLEDFKDYDNLIEEIEKEDKKLNEKINNVNKKIKQKTKKTNKDRFFDFKKVFKKKNNENEKFETIDDIYKKRRAVTGKLIMRLVFFFFISMAVIAAVVLFTQEGKTAPKRKVLKQQEEFKINTSYNLWKLQTNNQINSLKENMNRLKEDVKDDLNETMNKINNKLSGTIKKVNQQLLTVNKQIQKNINTTKKLSLKLNQLIVDFTKRLQEQKVDILATIDKKIAKINKEKNKNSETSLPLLPPLKNAVSIGKEEKQNQNSETVKIVNNFNNREENLKKEEEKISLGIPIVVQKDKQVNFQQLYVQNYEKKQKKKKPNIPYHLLTGLVKGTLLTGVSAPTFSQGQANPKPVLISVDSKSLIANGQTQNIKNCLLIGIAVGNLNSGRAEIKITRISCVIPYNNEYSYKLEAVGNPMGWVIGEDGKYGLKGRLVDSSGKIIMRQLIIGFLQGVANAFSNTNIVTIPYGTTGELPTPSATLKSGIAQGANTALNSLAEYYKKMLDAVYPVIDVMAGRDITVFIKGFEDVKITKFKRLDFAKRMENGQQQNEDEGVLIVNDDSF